MDGVGAGQTVDPKKTAEQIVQFGPKRSLCGVVTRPAGQATRLPVIIFNTGIIHRVGHHRIYVTLSRKLAAEGHPVIRFDFGGVGDSPIQYEDMPTLDGNLASIDDVCNWVEQNLGQSRVILMGLCSGADHSIIYASKHKQVAGVVLLDPSIPRTFRFYVNDFMRRARRPKVWTNLATGQGKTWARIRRMGVRPDPRIEPEVQGDEPFAPAELESPEAIEFLESTYRNAIENGTELLAVFTGGHYYQHNYRRQILDALPNVDFKNQLELHYYAESDHTFTYERDRERLFTVLDNWLDRKFASI